MRNPLQRVYLPGEDGLHGLPEPAAVLGRVPGPGLLRGARHDHCGVCGDFVCKLLHSFAYDAEHGDGAGARLETCRRWAKGD